MEEACLALEREFKKVLMDLEYTSMTLEAEYDQQQESHEKKENIFLIHQKINRIRGQLQRIQSKSEELIKKRQTIIPEVTKSLLQNFNDLQLLKNQCHLEPNSQDEDQKESLITIMEQAGYSEMARYRHHPDERVETKTKRKMKSILKQQHQQQEENEEEIGKVSSLTSTDNPESNEISNENIDNQNIVLSSYSNNTMNTTDINLKSNSQTIPPPPLPTCHGPEVDDIPRSRNQFNGTISTEEFQNISSHIRGRCSLHDTQRLLTYLRSEYIKFITKSPSLSPPAMSIQQLDQLGYRVCGQTGQCMLKTLHKLGYIELSKKGDMVTLSSIGMQGIVKKKKK